MAMNPDIEVYIDELVLYGFSPHDRYRLGQALESELTRLFAQTGSHSAFRNNMEIPFLNGGQFNMTHAANGHEVGGKVASLVYSSVNTPVSEEEHHSSHQSKNQR